MNGALWRIDDQKLVHAMRGVEGQLLPSVIARRDDLEHERGRGMPDTARTWAVQTTIWNSIVVRTAKSELPNQRLETRRPGRRPKQRRELFGDSLMRKARWGDHAVSTLPHLVAVVEAETTPTFQQRLDLDRRRVNDQGGHLAESSALPRRRAEAAENTKPAEIPGPETGSDPLR
jgi:hypothetical protein